MMTCIGGQWDTLTMYEVVVHEIAHMWHPMQIGSDEKRFAWMDEGFAQFTQSLDVAVRPLRVHGGRAALPHHREYRPGHRVAPRELVRRAGIVVERGQRRREGEVTALDPPESAQRAHPSRTSGSSLTIRTLPWVGASNTRRRSQPGRLDARNLPGCKRIGERLQCQLMHH